MTVPGAPLGRATGVQACLTPESLNVNRNPITNRIERGTMPFVPGADPPDFQRGHLLGVQFGGNNSRENLVPQTMAANLGRAPNQMPASRRMG